MQVKPIYQDNGECLMLYCCGWQDLHNLPSNSHIRHFCHGGSAAGCCSEPAGGCGGCGT